MLKIAKGRISYPAVIGAVLFMIVQVIATLNLPSLTSNIVNNGWLLVTLVISGKSDLK